MSRLFGFVCNDADRTRCALHLVAPVLHVGGEGRRDGYGIGFYQNGEVLLKKRPIVSGGGVDFYQQVKDLRTDALVGHVREATIGNLKMENTHPFRFRSWVFAHNGTVEHFTGIKDAILASTPDFLRRNIRGDTDSEHVFHLFLAFLHDAGKIDDPNITVSAAADALRATFAFIDRLAGEVGAGRSVLNIIVTNGRIMLGARRGRPMHAFRRAGVEDCAVCRQPAVAYGAEPKRITHEHLRTVVIASEPVTAPGPGWEELPEDSVVMVDREINLSVASLAAK